MGWVPGQARKSSYPARIRAEQTPVCMQHGSGEDCYRSPIQGCSRFLGTAGTLRAMSICGNKRPGGLFPDQVVGSPAGISFALVASYS